MQNGLGSHQSNYIWLFLTPIIGIVLSVMYEQRFLGGKLIKGITKILYAITRRKGELDRRDMYGHLITSALTVGMGGSAGLEAPIVLTGSAIGSNISNQLQLGYKERTLLLACGASAGISAILMRPLPGSSLPPRCCWPKFPSLYLCHCSFRRPQLRCCRNSFSSTVCLHWWKKVGG